MLAACAAPAFVRAASLMPISAPKIVAPDIWVPNVIKGNRILTVEEITRQALIVLDCHIGKYWDREYRKDLDYFSGEKWAING
jgi:hypothetical protein